MSYTDFLKSKVVVAPKSGFELAQSELNPALWHDLEMERHAIKAALPEAVEVYGTQDLDERESRVVDFAEGRTRLLATKKEISGQGCNFQRHCHRAVFLGIDYKFNDFIQAIHRIYRFLQTQEVVIDIIYTESEEQVREALEKKWRQHDELQRQMVAIVKKYGLHDGLIEERMCRGMGVERLEICGERYKAVRADCVEETARMEENSVDLIVTSIPFSNHYEYTPSYNDFGHNEDTAKFFEQMGYLSPNLLRVLKPGRVFACHVKDRVLFGNATGTGMPTMEPKGYAEEMAECLRYYRQIKADAQTFAGYATGGMAYAFIPLAQAMRVAPTVTVSGKFYYTLGSAQDTSAETGTLHRAGTERVIVKFPVSITSVCTGVITPQGEIDLSADL